MTLSYGGNPESLSYLGSNKYRVVTVVTDISLRTDRMDRGTRRQNWQQAARLQSLREHSVHCWAPWRIKLINETFAQQAKDQLSRPPGSTD